MFLHIAAIAFYCPIILYFALPTCRLTEIEVSNIVYCMVMAQFSRTTTKKHGGPQFHGRVPSIIWNWGPRGPQNIRKLGTQVFNFIWKWGPHFHLTPVSSHSCNCSDTLWVPQHQSSKVYTHLFVASFAAFFHCSMKFVYCKQRLNAAETWQQGYKSVRFVVWFSFLHCLAGLDEAQMKWQCKSIQVDLVPPGS